jgi:SAM-dependent methyltransferase
VGWFRKSKAEPRAEDSAAAEDWPEISPWVRRFAANVPPFSRVLDLACGSGRHAIFFAEHGALVDAVDRDPASVAVLAPHAGVHFTLADLEAGAWPYAGRQFDAIVVTNYLYRPLLPTLAASLAPGGLLLYETFMAGNEVFGRPSNPEFLLRPGELLAAFAGLEVLAFEQGVVVSPRRAWLQRLAALNTPRAALCRLDAAL